MRQLAHVLLISIYFSFDKEKLLLNNGSCLPEMTGMASHHFLFVSSEEKELGWFQVFNTPQVQSVTEVTFRSSIT